MESAHMLIVISLAYAAAQIIGQNGGVLSPSEHHMHLNGCVLPLTNELMEFNESRSVLELCQLITCQEDRKISYKRCESILLPENCTLTDYNFTLPYPHCCATMICNKDAEPNVTTESPVDINATTGLDISAITANSTDEGNLAKGENVNSSNPFDVDMPLVVKEKKSMNESEIRIKHQPDQINYTGRAKEKNKTTEENNHDGESHNGDIYDDKFSKKLSTESDKPLKIGDDPPEVNDKAERNKTTAVNNTNTSAETTLLEPLKHSSVVQKIESKSAVEKPVDPLDDNGNNKGCYSRELDVVLPIGVDVEPIDGHNCRRFTCQENGETVISTCGAIVAPTRCITYGNMSLEYPNCCPRVYCPLDLNPIPYVVNESDEHKAAD